MAGPLEPTDDTLTLITPDRSCGKHAHDDVPWDPPIVTETPSEIAIRVDVAVMPDGTRCRSDQQGRIKIRLSERVADRSIRNVGYDGVRPIVNPIDPIDTGLTYSCGSQAIPIVDLLGPGLEQRSGIPPSSLEDARLVVDAGDLVQYISAWSLKGRTRSEWRWFDGTTWQGDGQGRCSPVAVLAPGTFAATWRLRGPRPAPGARRLRINVQGRPCHGSPPVGQVTQPLVQVRKDSIVIIIGTFFENQKPPGLLSAEAEGGFAFIDCNGFGPVRMTIDLHVALGKRVLYDGGVFPPAWRGKAR